MAVPKKKRSKRKSRIKRASWKITAPNLVACTNCGKKIHQHRACQECGHYKGKQVIQIKIKEAKTKDQ